MDASAHFRERGELITHLMSGTLDAADVVVHTRPAVELLGLLVPIDSLTQDYLSGREPRGLRVTRSEFEPWRRQLLAVVAALVERWVGDDEDSWLALAMRAGSHRGSVPELIDSVVRPERADPESWSGRAPRWPRGVDASAVLLAMAPPGTLEAFLGECATNEAAGGILTRMLDRGPLHPKFVDYALSALGTDSMRAALHRNPAYELAKVRAHVLRERHDIAVLEHAYFTPGADGALRVGLVRLAEAAGGFRPDFVSRLKTHNKDASVLEPLLVSDDPVLVHWVLRRVNSSLTESAIRWAAYATLALTTGPEPVWALEQERVGALSRMAEPVRASILAGSVDPILDAADGALGNAGLPRTPIDLGAPLIEPPPYTELIEEFVDRDAYRTAVVDGLVGDRAAL
ncbi:hypothetical protein ABH935_009035 [Catenulispora sp. GAS73]|uniref:hypothetical protein n=1 Tax=Catenulispora sp. GAS73 TaxID=3156269 RepID=UPI00351832D3